MSANDRLLVREIVFSVSAYGYICLFALAGCGADNAIDKSFYPVKGKVLLEDGKPLTTGNVLFVGVSTNVSLPAPIGSDGAFEFTGDKPGLPAGEYRVAIDIEGRQTKRKARDPNRDPRTICHFAAKYLDEDASKLTATVKADSSGNDFCVQAHQVTAADWLRLADPRRMGSALESRGLSRPKGVTKSDRGALNVSNSRVR